jgi:hypothetical protein
MRLETVPISSSFGLYAAGDLDPAVQRAAGIEAAGDERGDDGLGPPLGEIVVVRLVFFSGSVPEDGDRQSSEFALDIKRSRLRSREPLESSSQRR